MDYWEECIRESFEDAGIKATDDQIDTVVGWVDGAHENYSMAHGHDCIESPYKAEAEHLKRELKKEQDKVVCEECKGKGHIVTYGGTFQSESTCFHCQGEGKI